MDAVFAAGMTVMAAHPTETEVDLAPGDETLHVDYHRDF
jgi:hypothetical protein